MGGGKTSAVEIAEEIAGARERVWISARERHPPRPEGRLLGRDTHDWFRPIERALPRWLTGSWCAAPKTHPASGDSFSALRRLGRIDVRPAITSILRNNACRVSGCRSAIDVDLIVTATGFRLSTRRFSPARGGASPQAVTSEHGTARACHGRASSSSGPLVRVEPRQRVPARHRARRTSRGGSDRRAPVSNYLVHVPRRDTSGRMLPALLPSRVVSELGTRQPSCVVCPAWTPSRGGNAIRQV